MDGIEKGCICLFQSEFRMKLYIPLSCKPVLSELYLMVCLWVRGIVDYVLDLTNN